MLGRASFLFWSEKADFCAIYPKMKNMQKIDDEFTNFCLQNDGFVVK